MEDLITWLRAQLDEDERVARAAIPGPWRWGPQPAKREGRLKLMGQGYRVVVNGVGPDVFPHESTAAFIQANHPARVLAEVEAKRRILDLHAGDGGHECVGPADAWGAATIYARDCPTVRLLVLPYADRPGFREEWRPAA